MVDISLKKCKDFNKHAMQVNMTYLRERVATEKLSKDYEKTISSNSPTAVQEKDSNR